jgi:hypothetical protein
LEEGGCILHWDKGGVHDLKHTFGTRLRMAGINFEDRQDLLGHKSKRITTHYSTAEVGNLVKAVNKIVYLNEKPSFVLLNNVIKMEMKIKESRKLFEDHVSKLKVLYVTSQTLLHSDACPERLFAHPCAHPFGAICFADVQISS